MKAKSPRTVPVLFTDNPQPMWVFDPRTLRFLDVNKAACRLLGYTRQELLRMTLQDVTAAGVAARVASLGPGVQDIGVRPVRKKDGSMALMRVVTHPVDFDGIAARFSVHTDVSTERAAVERALTATAWFESFFQSSSEAIVVTAAPDGRITRANPAFEKLLGYTEAELVKMTFADITAQPHQAASRRAFFDLSRGLPSIDLEKEYRRKDGALVPVLLRGFPIRLGGKTVGYAAVVRDITARRQAELALRDSEQLLFSVLRSAPDFIYRLDRQGRVTFANRIVPGIKPEDVLGKPVYRHIPKDMRPIWRRKLDDAFRSGGAVDFESLGYVEAGGRRAYRHRLAPLSRRAGVETLVAATTDITEQRRLEQERQRLENELKVSEEYWRTLLKQSPDFIIVIDRSLKISYVNRYAKSFTPKDVLGAPFERFIDPSFVPSSRRWVRRVFRSGEPAMWEIQAYGDGRALRWYSCSAAAVRKRGRIEQVMLACRDVTESKTLRARFEGVFRSSRDAIDYVSLDGTILEVNPAYERLTGYSREELLHKKTLRDLTPFEYRRLDRAAMRQLLQSGQPVEFEKEYIRRDGSRVPVRLTTFLVKDPAGRPMGFAAIIQDITERKVLEREILEAGAREQSKLGRDLHDTVGQTLTGLSLIAKTLRDKLGRRDGPIADDAARLAELSSLAVRQARGLARGLLPRELQSAGLAQALRELAGQARDLFGIECRVAASDDVRLNDESRAIQLYRIAQEAVHNAAKHARSPAGVRIRLSTGPARVRLEISDQGVGIPPVTRRGRGLGLGIMEHRARMIGATLTIKPGPRRGTVVTCDCPIPPLPLQRKA